MRTSERDAICEHHLFSQMDKDTARALVEAARILRFAADEIVFDQGAEAHSFFALLEGRLRVTKVNAAGQQIVIRFVSPGDVFGIAAAIGRTTYPATATAIVPSLALAWPNASWPRLVAEHPVLATQTLLHVGARLQEAHARVASLSTSEVEARLAGTLLALAKEAGHDRDGVIALDFPISRQDLAEMTGTTMHTVSRVLSAWSTRGLVRTGRKRIAIADRNALATLAKGDRDR